MEKTEGRKARKMERIGMRDRWIIGTKWMLDLMYVAGWGVTICLPWEIRFLGRYDSRMETYYLPMVALFVLSGLLAELIIRELRRMFASVLADDCFVRENVVSLRRMSVYSLGIVLLTAMRACLCLTPAALVEILVFLTAGLFSRVLSQVFDRAVAYKLENDLTI